MNNCLVLGGNGLIGSFVAEKLVAKGCNVRVFDKFTGKNNLKAIETKIEKVKGDYINQKDVRQALDGIEYVFHCIHTTVPRTSIEKPVFDAETNILPSINILRDSCELGVKKIVYLSSIVVYGNTKTIPAKENARLEPMTPYAVSKMAIEKYIEYFNRVYGIDYAILRPTTSYGERQVVSKGTGVIANFVFNALRNKPIVIYGNGSSEKDFLHAEDLASGVIAAGFNKSRFKIFNLGSGKVISLNNLAEKVKKATGNNIEINRLNKACEVQRLVCDISRACSELDWKPKISLDEGIKRCFAKFKKDV